MSRIWDDILTETDKQVILKGGYGKQRGLGKHPILLIIDPQYNYMGADEPIVEQLNRWPSGAGETAWRAGEKIIALKAVAEDRGIPVFISRNVQKGTLKFDSFGTKSNRDQTQYIDGAKGTQIVNEMPICDDDVLFDKSYASVFYGTPLQSYLIKLGIDTIVIVGGTTGGCCRASAVDAVTRNYNVLMVEDCLFDRISVSHKVALLDCWMKYCDVGTQQDAITYFSRFREGIYEA